MNFADMAGSSQASVHSIATSQSSLGSRSTRSTDSIESTNSKRSNAEERRAKKQKLAEEKAAKAAAIEKNKIYKPGECMKYMQIEMHPNLSSVWYMADVPREASAAGCRVVSASDLCNPALVMWNRILQPTLSGHNGQMTLSTKERCQRALYVCQIDSVAEHIAANSLSETVATARDMAGCHLTLVLFGVKDYFKTSGRQTSNSKKQLITDINLEMAITDLLVTADCDTILVDTPNELSLTIIQFTKAIAEAPHKHAKRAVDEQAEFYMRGDKKQSVAVDKDGNGLSRLWQQMLAVLPHSSLETSRSISAKHPSPLQLYEALQSANGVNELADIGVSRAAVPGAKSRRLGPEFARRLHTLFTAVDGNVLME